MHQRCSMIFCTASHTVGDYKLCGIYLIFHLDLNYIMGSQLQRMVFELLEFLSIVNMQLYVCHNRIGIIQGSFGHFLCIKWVFNAFMCIIQIWTTCICSNAYKLIKNQIYFLGCMLRSHARNGNEFQTLGHCWLLAECWDTLFLNSSKSKSRLKFMKLGMLSWSGINIPW